MRDLWPETPDKLQQLNADREREYNDLVDRINAVAEDCAENHRVDTAEIAAIKDTLTNMRSYISTDTINALLGRINDIEANTIDTTSIEADRAAITTSTVGTETVDNLKATNAELTEATINKATIAEADITKANITDLSFDNLEATNLDATEADIGTADIDTATVGNITVDDKANIGDLTAVKGDIDDLTSDKAEIREIQNNRIETEFLLHNTESIAITEPNRIIVELPYFVNGVYKILLLDNSNNNTYLSLEAFNSASNFIVKWTNGTSEGLIPLQRIVFFDNSLTTSQCYLEIMTNGKALTAYYQCDSYNTVTPPQITTDWPIDTSSRNAKVYDVSGYIAATLFNRPTISASGSSDVSTLTLSSSELYNTRTIEPTVYDTTVNRVRVMYTPDQNVNSTEAVKFLSVDAPFLNVADLDVANYFRAPNIYNGRELSEAEIADLPDETLYIPRTGGTSGEITSGIAIYDIPTLPVMPEDRPVLGDEIRYYSSSLAKAFAGQTFIIDEYKPQDGYSLHVDSYYEEVAIIPGADSKFGYQNTLIKNDQTNELYIMRPGAARDQQRWGIAKLSDISTNGSAIRSHIIQSGSLNHGVVTNEMAEAVPDWAVWNPEDPLNEYYVYGNLPNYNERFYIDVTPDAVYVPTGYYTVIYPNIGFRCLGLMTYTRVGNEGKLYRKTTCNNSVSVLPLIPYREVEE
jgi:hypothetical protein